MKFESISIETKANFKQGLDISHIEKITSLLKGRFQTLRSRSTIDMLRRSST